MIYFTRSIQSLILLRLYCVTTASLLVSCTKSSTIHHMIKEEASLIDPSAEDGTSNASSSLEDPIPTSPSFAIVLLHGLGNDHNELGTPDGEKANGMAKALRDYFGEHLHIIQPKSRNGCKSGIFSVARQAKYVLQEITTELSTDDIDPTTFPIGLIGYSQGGVVGCELVRNYKQDLNIKLVITMNAPLNGTPVLDATLDDIRRCMRNGQQGFDVVYNNDTMKALYKESEKQLASISQVTENALRIGRMLRIVRCLGPFFGGIRDIRPNQGTVGNINNFLRTENTTIPFLLISSYQDDFEGLFDLGQTSDDTDANDINKALALFITKKETAKHDTLIPLASQLARGESFEELGILSEGTTPNGSELPIVVELPGNSMVKGYIYKNITHAGNLVAIDPSLYITNEAIYSIISSPQVQKDVCEYLNNIFRPKQEIAL